MLFFPGAIWRDRTPRPTRESWFTGTLELLSDTIKYRRIHNTHAYSPVFLLVSLSDTHTHSHKHTHKKTNKLTNTQTDTQTSTLSTLLSLPLPMPLLNLIDALLWYRVCPVPKVPLDYQAKR